MGVTSNIIVATQLVLFIETILYISFHCCNLRLGLLNPIETEAALCLSNTPFYYKVISSFFLLLMPSIFYRCFCQLKSKRRVPILYPFSNSLMVVSSFVVVVVFSFLYSVVFWFLLYLCIFGLKVLMLTFL